MDERRLNVFQRVMRLWDVVHPYNAVQVLKLGGGADIARLGETWRAMSAALGVGKVTVNGVGFYHEAGDEAVRVVEGLSLEDFVSQELNRPFEEEREGAHSFSPFRPFVLQADDSYFAGIVYHHWAADSASIRMLLREWFYRMYEPASARTIPLRIPSGGYWHFFGPGRGGWRLNDGLLSTMRLTTRFSNARRVEQHIEDYEVASAIEPLPDGMIDTLRKAARRQGVKLNDVFLAATAEACAKHGITRLAPGRQELALGTIVDLRPSCAEDMSDVFGLFLGFTTVVVRPQALQEWDGLLAAISRQSTWQKEGNLAQSSLLRMGAAIAESRFLSPRTWVRFYQKHMPLAAGISNVNLGNSWAGEYHPSPILDYLRFSPTGPAMPVVFTPSSLGHKSHLALTYRVKLLGAERAAAIVRTFVKRLEIFARDGEQNGAENLSRTSLRANLSAVVNL